jgi:replicative DNA helicase
MIDVRVGLEKSVLGGVLQFPKVWDDLNLVADYFQHALSRLVFDRILNLRRDGVEPDVLTVAAGLDGEAVQWVFECTGEAPLAEIAVGYHVQQLKAIWAKSELNLAARIMQEGSADPAVPVDVLIADALKAVDTVSGSQASLTITYPASYLDEYVAEMGVRTPFMPTAWRRLNKLLGGWRDSAFYVIAGRPGQGKTIVALQAAFQLAKSGKHVLYFSLEMPEMQLQHRLLAQALSLDVSHIANDELDYEVVNKDGSYSYARELVRDAFMKLTDNLGIVSAPKLTPNLLRAYISAASKRCDVDAVFIDYLGLMDDDVAHRDKVNKIGSVSNQLKRIALELNIPVVAAVQLNREIEQRSDHKPQLSDLRDSGSIEQDADVILMIARKKRQGDPDDGNGSEFYLKVAKNRHGAMGAAKFVAQDGYSRIVED